MLTRNGWVRPFLYLFLSLSFLYSFSLSHLSEFLKVSFIDRRGKMVRQTMERGRDDMDRRWSMAVNRWPGIVTKGAKRQVEEQDGFSYPTILTRKQLRLTGEEKGRNRKAMTKSWERIRPFPFYIPFLYPSSSRTHLWILHSSTFERRWMERYRREVHLRGIPISFLSQLGTSLLFR